MLAGYTILLIVLHALALLLGMAAWMIPIVGRCKGKSLSALSWCCGALSAWIPAVCMDLFVRVDDLSTILDVAGAYNFAAAVMLAGTLISNLVFVRREARG